jgi:aspartate/methionine/tyrosine aminotransferase
MSITPSNNHTHKHHQLDPLSGEWALDTEALRARLSEKSRVLIFNSPHNPTGKVFSRAEMAQVPTLTLTLTLTTITIITTTIIITIITITTITTYH